MEFRAVGPNEERLLLDLLGRVDTTFFRPHPFTPDEVGRIARRRGRDVYGILVHGDQAIAYGLLRGWDEGFATPSLGIAVRDDAQGRGAGRVMMAHLHYEARARGASRIRLRVHPENERARRLYESLGYEYRGEDRGEFVMVLHLNRRHGGSVGPSGGSPREPVVHLLPPGPDWDAWLARAPHDVYHLAGYHEHAHAAGEGEPFLAVAGDERRGLAWPYLLRSVAEIPELAASRATDVTSVYGYPGPVAWGVEPGDGFVAAAFARVAEAWREQGAIAAFTRFHPLLENAGLLVETAGFPEAAGEGHGVIAGGSTVSIDLTSPDEVVRAEYKRGLRREIDASRRAGLVTEEDEQWRHVGEFTELYHGTMSRCGAADYYYFSEADFRDLRSVLAGRLHLLVTFLGSVVAAAGLFTELEGLVEWHLVGSSAALSALSPAKVLVDDAIRWARGRGDRILHMGGGRGCQEDSLMWFKGRFSPRRHAFHTGRWVLDPVTYDELVAGRAAAADGRTLADPCYFPTYRAPLSVAGDGIAADAVSPDADPVTAR